MAQDWRFSSDKARAELGYEPRPLDETLRATIGWYQELMAGGTFENGEASALSVAAQVVQAAGRVGLVQGLQVGGRVLGRRLVAGA
jgi:hypothetical protein